MKLIKDSVSINEIVYQDFSQVMVDGDIIVPDVKPDILKILQVDAVSAITSKDIENGRVTINGKVCLKILYVPDRKESCIKSIITSFDFVHKIENPVIKDNMTVCVESDVDMVEFNLINSRKLCVKTVVGINSEICGNRVVEMVTDVDNDSCVEIKRKPICVHNMIADLDEEFVIKDSIEVPSGKMSIGEILKIDYKISDKEMKIVSGKVVAKGTVNISVLYVGENNCLEFMETDIPFTEVFDVPDIAEGMNCDIMYAIADMYYETCEDSDGDNRIITIEFLLSAKVKAGENMKIDAVSDFYCPGFETDIARSECMVGEIICRPSMQNTLREIISIEDNYPQIVGVYNVITKAYITKTIIENGKIMVEGLVDCYILYLTDNIDNPVYSYKKEIPFSYLIEAQGAERGMECDVSAEVEHTSYNLNIANEVELRCILSINAKVLQQNNVDLISNAELSEINGSEKMGIVIYFVQPGDSLWKIAKHYHVAMNDIIVMNDLDPLKPLDISQQLIIPISSKKTA